MRTFASLVASLFAGGATSTTAGDYDVLATKYVR